MSILKVNKGQGLEPALCPVCKQQLDDNQWLYGNGGKTYHRECWENKSTV